MADVPARQRWRDMWLVRDGRLERGQYLITDDQQIVLAGGNIHAGTQHRMKANPRREPTTVLAAEDVVKALMQEAHIPLEELQH